MESNHLPPGYEPDELPMLYTAIKRTKIMSGRIAAIVEFPPAACLRPAKQSKEQKEAPRWRISLTATRFIYRSARYVLKDLCPRVYSHSAFALIRDPAELWRGKSQMHFALRTDASAALGLYFYLDSPSRV